ncbi:hypothetical protein E1B28_013696 [Marasmius oreades]|uniref:Transmembrane protein n=1 Tax=Marasmius oreades TaxID=181124 RepID=A0A9P7UNA3_9AGAR|nr:uncharacterized protein E1B28_013696 [Marasmius oreades]KAG7087755.1 hypothetical protein E1B28_013696 [Marasmius oreades]
MAAILNGLLIPDSVSEASSPRPHSRTFSTVTSDTVGSHLTEPLLQHHHSGSDTYHDIPSRQPSHFDGTSYQPDMLDLSSDGSPNTPEKRGHRAQHHVRRRLRAWKGVGITLEVVLGLWAIYTTVRYFIAYIVYSSTVGQNLALGLACTSTIAFAFLICDAVVTVFRTRLIASRSSLRSLLLLRTVFLCLSFFFLLCVAIVNLVVTIVLRCSHTSELSADLRCNLDIDVIWSISSSKTSCPPESSNWTGWIALAIFRVAATLVLVLSMLITTSQYNITRRRLNRKRRRWRSATGNGKNRESSMVDRATSTPQPSTSQLGAAMRQPPSPLSRTDSRQTNNGNNNDCRPHQTVESTSGDLANCRRESDEDLCLDPAVATRFDTAALQQRLTDAIYLSPGAGGGLTMSSLPDPLSIRDDRELSNFVDRFRLLVSQITRETEDAMEFARPDTVVTATPVDEDESDESDDESENSFLFGLGFGLTGYHVGGGRGGGRGGATLGYDEFGRPYPPEEHVRILNSYVRRMPTIESLGSRDFGSGTTGSVYSGRTSQSMQTLSRPPTVMINQSEFGGSNPSSRAASLTLSMTGPGGSAPPSRAASLVLSTTGASGGTPQTPRTPVLEDGRQRESPVDESGVGRLPSPGGITHSRSTFSFHTAYSGGGGSVSSPSSEQYVSFSSEDSRPP